VRDLTAQGLTAACIGEVLAPLDARILVE
jgi:hypothetical protein